METFFQYVPGKPVDLLSISKKSITGPDKEIALLEMANNGLITIDRRCKFLYLFQDSELLYNIVSNEYFTDEIIFKANDKFYFTVANTIIPFLIFQLQNDSRKEFREYCQNYLFCLGPDAIPFIKNYIKNNKVSFRMKRLIKSVIKKLENYEKLKQSILDWKPR